MTDKIKAMTEDGLLAAAKTFQDTFKGEGNEDNLYQHAYDYINELKADNAALRERLEKAVECPCKIGDTVYEVYDKCDGHNCPYNGYYGQWRCNYCGKKRCKPFIETRAFYYDDIPRINKTVFVSKKAAEKRLAELGGEK